MAHAWRSRKIEVVFGLAASLLAPAAGLAQDAGTAGYLFAAPPSSQANRVYSVNRQTGDISACQFERPDVAQVGLTRCFPAGEGAGPQPKGDYGLVSTQYGGETGVFRVNAQTGEMSICYVRDVPKSGGGSEPRILCTAPAK
ncbi:hypothetical protein [Aquabacter spiritensis]|uniref:Uncharacterized protein n=1 Tax=Aquabacter spiritensis TaxID=933073 RepID=A0A4R3LT06_9HYPH|nr:hypothetical protein [Aquabacter spiritensis]TCT03511.1 hypothetical protein EDC64_10961 [Aquabacter spiritensis]